MQSPSNLFKPPAQIRPRSSHRDNSQTAAFSSETTVGKSYRPFTPEEAKNARIRYSLFEHLYGGYNLIIMIIYIITNFWPKLKFFLRFKRIGSSHGRVDPNNPNKFAGASTFSADYTEHGYNRPGQIRPKENNIDFGKDGAELISSNRKLQYVFISDKCTL